MQLLMLQQDKPEEFINTGQTKSNREFIKLSALETGLV